MLISHQARANRQGVGIAVRGCAAFLLTRVREGTRMIGENRRASGSSDIFSPFRAVT